MSDYEKYIIARWCYSQGVDFISDADYNLLHKYMQKERPDDVYVNRSWSSDPCPVDLLTKYGMENLAKKVVLTDKTESIPSITDFKVLESIYGNMQGIATLSFKHDGWNLQATYYNGSLMNIQTRGRLLDPKSAMCLRRCLPPTIPAMGTVLIVSEGTIPDACWERVKIKYGTTSQRHTVSTMIAQGDTDNIILHSFNIIGYPTDDVFATLTKWGFHTPEFTYVTTFAELIESIKLFSAKKDTYGFPTDGLVIKGEVTNAIRMFAWEEAVHRSYVIGYLEEYSTHAIPISCNIRSIKLPQCKISQVACTNLARIIKYNLQVGAPIAFLMRSGTTPVLDVTNTLLLHKMWESNWADYRSSIDMDEEMKL